MLRQLGNPQQAGILQGQVPSSVMNPGPGYQNPMLRQGYPNAVIVGQDGAGMGGDAKGQLVRTALLNNNKRYFSQLDSMSTISPPHAWPNGYKMHFFRCLAIYSYILRTNAC